jgi:hypothetical protein
VIIFYFLRFPLNIPLPSTRNSSFFHTNPLSPFDYDPFNIPDTRYVSGFVDESSKQFQVFQVNSSFFTVLFTSKPTFGGESLILQAFGTVFASIVQFTT